MYDYDTTVTINDDGVIYLNPPGRRKRKLGFVGSRADRKKLLEGDLSLADLWLYANERLEQVDLRFLITLTGERSESYYPHGILMIAFALERSVMKKRWGFGDFDVIAKELIARLEDALPLPRAGVVIYHQELPQRWFVSVPLGNLEEVDLFTKALASTIEDFPGVKLAME